MKPKTDMSIEDLTSAWKWAKEEVSRAQEQLLSIESAIYEKVKNELPDKGTKSFDTGLKIVTGFAEAWDQEKVQEARELWPSALNFPFKPEWKPDGKAISYIRDNEPRAYVLLRDALTLKPKKPAFSVKE